MARFRRIMHPTDFSRASRAAFAKAVELARGNRAELIVVHALAPIAPFVGEGYISPQLYDDLERSMRTQGQKQLGALLARARGAGLRARGLLLQGIPHARIVTAARQHRADLIVIGTHGRTGLAKLVLGSVAARVVATAPCPVLTVHGRTRRP